MGTADSWSPRGQRHPAVVRERCRRSPEPAARLLPRGAKLSRKRPGTQWWGHGAPRTARDLALNPAQPPGLFSHGALPESAFPTQQSPGCSEASRPMRKTWPNRRLPGQGFTLHAWVGQGIQADRRACKAITARDSMAKSLYSALFDWIVLRINHALLNKKDMEESVSCLSIGVLDIFGFEDFERNSFEQFCINYANEQLQYYFNQHIFKLEQEEYQSEGISWHNIDYTDNVGCIHLISKKPTGLFYLLDEESKITASMEKLQSPSAAGDPHPPNFICSVSPAGLGSSGARGHLGELQRGASTPSEKLYRCSMLDFSFDGSEEFDINAFEDIIAFYESKKLQEALKREAFSSDPRCHVANSVQPEVAPAPCLPGGLNPSSWCRREWQQCSGFPQLHVLAPVAWGRSRPCQGPRGGGPAALTWSSLYHCTPSPPPSDLHDQIIKTIKGLPWQGDDPRRLLQSLSRLQKPRTFILSNPKAPLPRPHLSSLRDRPLPCCRGGGLEGPLWTGLMFANV
eukprot:bmy_02580T0